jgi:hypothetical protein
MSAPSAILPVIVILSVATPERSEGVTKSKDPYPLPISLPFRPPPNPPWNA